MASVMASVSASASSNYEETIDRDIDTALLLINPNYASFAPDNPVRTLLVAYYKYRSCFDVSSELKMKQDLLNIYIKDQYNYEIKKHDNEKIHESRKIIEELEICNRIFALRRGMRENSYLKKRELAKAFTNEVIRIYKADKYSDEDFYNIFGNLQIFERTFKDHPGAAILNDYYFYNPIFAILMAFILNIDDYLRENTHPSKLFSSMFGYMDQTGVSGTYSLVKIKRYFPDVFTAYERKVKTEFSYGSDFYNSPIIGVNTMSNFFSKKENEPLIKRRKPNAGHLRTRKLWSKIRNSIFLKNKKIKLERKSRKKRKPRYTKCYRKIKSLKKRCTKRRRKKT